MRMTRRLPRSIHPTPASETSSQNGGGLAAIVPSTLRWLLDLEDLAATVEILDARYRHLEQRLEALALPATQPITVKQLAAKHPAFPEPRLRWMLFHRKTNGLDRVVIQGRGGRLLLDERAFLEWVAEGRENVQGTLPQPTRPRRVGPSVTVLPHASRKRGSRR